MSEIYNFTNKMNKFLLYIGYVFIFIICITTAYPQKSGKILLFHLSFLRFVVFVFDKLKTSWIWMDYNCV